MHESAGGEAFWRTLIALAGTYSDKFQRSRDDLFLTLTADLLGASHELTVYKREEASYVLISAGTGYSWKAPKLLPLNYLSIPSNIIGVPIPIRGAVSTYGIAGRPPSVSSAEPEILQGILAERCRLVGMLLDLFEYRSRASDDLKSAQEIQASLLPRMLPILPGLDLAVRFRAARMVSGDYYNIFIEGSRVTTIVGDVSGKGIAAALVMACLSAQIDHLRKRRASHLSEIMAALNTLLYESTPPQSYVTLHYNVIDLERQTMTYVSAGHNPPALHFLRARNQLVRLDAGGLMLGLMPTAKLAFEVGEVVLERGDAVLIATDGLTDAEGLDGSDFGIEHLERAASDALHMTSTSQQLVDTIFEQVDKFAEQSSEQQDDMTLACLRVTLDLRS